MTDYVLVAVGLVALLGGAWLVVRSAARLATMLGLSRVLIGATVVAFGTSAPEFVVNLLASLRDADGLAAGNVLGSNVTNVALVLGGAALIAPLSIHSRLLRWEIPVLSGVTVLVLLLAANGRIGRIEGAVLFAVLVAFIVLSLRISPEGVAVLEGEELPDAPEQRNSSRTRELVLLAVGLAALASGAESLVRGATSIAEQFGVSEVVIGVVIVALGTSLPEVATSVVAAMRREHEIAVANVVGSNIFNLAGVFGLTAALAPLDIDRDLYRFEMPVLFVSTAVLLPLAWPRGRIGRIEGFALLAAYVAFIAVVLSRG